VQIFLGHLVVVSTWQTEWTACCARFARGSGYLSRNQGKEAEGVD